MTKGGKVLTMSDLLNNLATAWLRTGKRILTNIKGII